MICKPVALKTLHASGQPRPLITADVDKLAASIKAVGLIQPITVRPAVVMNGIAEQGFQIVAGHHRVAACRALGWTEIDAIVVDAPEYLRAELIEIDENLCRSELTPAQRSSFAKRRKQVWEALNPDEQQVEQEIPPVAKHGHAQPKGFAAETAAVSGMTKQAINRHIARAEALGDDLERVVGTSLDKGTELDALAALPVPERSALVDRAAAGEKVSAISEITRPRKGNEPVETFASLRIRVAELEAENAELRRQLADARRLMEVA